MLVATFGPSTGWVGKTITYEDGQFAVEDYGLILAQDVLQYDCQGHIEWAYSGLREWVTHLAAEQNDSLPAHDRAIEPPDAGESAKEIRLTQGQVALVDVADHAWLSRWKWHAQKWHSQGVTKFYANRNDRAAKRIIGMHRQIMGFPENLEVHHLNGNSLDNRRSNLSAVTVEINQRDSSAGWGESRFRGVTLDKTRGLWKAHTRIRKRHYDLGYFPTEEEAARALDRKRHEVYGDLVQPVVKDEPGKDPTTLF